MKWKRVTTIIIFFLILEKAGRAEWNSIVYYIYWSLLTRFQVMQMLIGDNVYKSKESTA